ncbi:putative protein gar2-like [Capsicum annuum]|nr:putative protein gar2-like [Capsicum annuum]
MDSQTTVKTLTEDPLQYRAFVQNHILKDASFSTYIKPEEHTPPEDSEINVFDAKKYFSETNDSSPEVENKLVEPCELASAHRHSSVSSVDNNSYGRNFRANSFRATPTASSEASWNSQTGLLANPPGAISVSLRGINPNEKKRTTFSTRTWLFCRKCPCSGKKSVQVEETSSEPRTESTGSEHFPIKHKVVLEKTTNMSQKNSIEVQQRTARTQSLDIHPVPVPLSLGTMNKIGTIQRRLSESEITTTTHITPCQQRVLAPVRPFTETAGGGGGGGFSFPILNNSAQAAKLGIKPPPTRSSISPILEDPARDSIEVFQPSSRKSTETDHHHHRCNFPFPGSPISRVTATDDDAASDASSDLFEIESFSTSIATSSCPLYRQQRHSLEEPGTPSVAATECYAPSEVSIDWSVTTAEGFDRASVTNYSSVSEIDNNVSNSRLFGGVSSSGNNSNGTGEAGGKWKGGGLLSCRHEKAVNVGPQPVKYGLPEGPPQLPLITTAGHVGSRPMPRANKPPIASSHSARLSLAFAA